MNWLSQGAEALIEKCKTDNGNGTVDVAVVGSGYGGAVAALRFAEHGQQVYVLERGQEYVSGEFPNDVSQVGKHVRSEVASASGVATQGYEEALFDFRIGLNAGALIGNGLGGGSLINAGVGLQPDARVFKGDEWPAALRQEALGDWFHRARAMHELQTPGQPGAGCTQPVDMLRTAKHQRLHDLRASAQLRRNRPATDRHTDIAFEAAAIAVQLDSPARQDLGPRQSCIGCGDCVSGCNHQAKLSLTATYLPAAVKAGASLFTGVSVLHVSHDAAGNSVFPWVVHFVRTGERTLQHDIQSHPAAHTASASQEDWVYTLRARRVVLGAGAFGSTEILLRSRARGLSLSNTALGVGVSGNGDDVAYGYDMLYTANATGWGSKEKPQPVVGPTITGTIHFTDPDDVKRSTLIQDGAVPGIMRGVVHELLTTLGTLNQMDGWAMRARDGGDPMALKPAALMRTLTLLGMGHDTAGAVMAYHAPTDRVQWGWPKAAQETTQALHKARMQGAVTELGGIYIQNPAASVIPDSMSSVLSGPKPGATLFTVHPLGGCRMSDMAVAGVVNHWGAAWTADGELHDGLYVMDGSTIPGSLGANPMLTITALAERSCALILKGIPAQKNTPHALPAYPAAAAPLQVPDDVHSSVRLAEVLRGTLNVNTKALPQSMQADPSQPFGGLNAPCVALFLQFEVAHWQSLMDDKRHRVSVTPAASTGGSYSFSRLTIDTLDAQGRPGTQELVLTGGWVELFAQRQDDAWTRSWRWLRTARTYVVGRWWPDYQKEQDLKRRQGRSNGKSSFSIERILKFTSALPGLLARLVSAAKLITHANEVREFRYHLALKDKAERRYTLIGTKVFEAAASSAALKEQAAASGWPAPQRRSLWQQLTELQVELYLDACGAPDKQGLPFATARLAMDLPDMLRRVMPQITQQRDTLGALLEFASYPMMLARVILKTRILDFRLPDYRINTRGEADLPDTDPATIAKPDGYFELDAVKYPDIPGPAGSTIAAQVCKLEVPLTRPQHPGEGPEQIRIGLVRYAATTLTATVVGGLTRAKSIVLLNGFLLSTQAFVAEELNARGGNLAAQLHAAGWDVWLLEYRASPLLDVSARNSSMDDIAAFDIPRAVAHIVKTVSEQLHSETEKTQIFAFSRCVGSAALAMSLLSGFLRHPNQQHNQLAGVQFSDFHPFLVGSPSAQMRLQLAAFLSNAFKLEYLQFTAGTARADALHALLDRAFASAHYAYPTDADTLYAHEVAGQRCPHEADLRQPQHDSTTCKRISGLMSRSYHHPQLLTETHEKLDFYFGRGNLSVFLQGTKCLAYERLVNADGQNVYVTDKAIKEYLTMPLMLVHGVHNALFDVESFTRSRLQLKRILGNRASGSPNHYLRFKHFGHVDLILGKDAPKQVFPHIITFFEKALHAPPVNSPPANNRCRARMARTGPMVGWIRPGPNDTTLVRLWIEVDDTQTDTPIAALTTLDYPGGHSVQAWALQTQELASQAKGDFDDGLAAGADPHSRALGAPKLIYAVADIAVPNAQRNAVTLQMVSIHQYAGPQARNAPASGYPAAWGVPMLISEISAGPSKAPGDLGGGDKASPMQTHGQAEVQVEIITGTVAPVFGKNAPAGEPGPGLLQQVAAGRAHAEPDQPHRPNEMPTPHQILPLDIAASDLNDDLFLLPLKADLELANSTTHRANPGTLSRQRRTLRRFGQRLITLQRAQLGSASTDSLGFLAAGCRHPGLTGFEFDRADASLMQASAGLSTPDSPLPSFMLMLGDQIYADARAGVLDTQSPIEKLLPRYRDAFGASKGFRSLAQRLPLYMVPDDHEINDNWSAEQTQAGGVSRALASNAVQAFKVFQYAHGPGQPVHGHGPVRGFNTRFCQGGLPFLVLDTRTQRTRVPHRQLLHDSQWRWMEAWLLAEQAKGTGAHPKFIASGSVLAPGLKENCGYPSPRGADTWQLSPPERARLLSFIADNHIDNVVFVSSDYHCAAVASLSFSHSAVKAWAIVAPPLHAPLRFANQEASQVMASESISLSRGRASIEATAWNGEGWLDCRVRRLRPHAYAIELRFWLRQLEQADWPVAPLERTWQLRGHSPTDKA